MVENALYTEPAVFEAAAVGLPDVRLGELVAVVVSLKPGWGKVGEKALITTASKRFVFFFALSSEWKTEVCLGDVVWAASRGLRSL